MARIPSVDRGGILLRSAVFILLSAVLVPACGDGAPEEQLAEARADLREVREEVEAREEAVKARREAVRRAEEALATARAELEEAESDLEKARQKIDARATDVALFRAVQSALLSDERLESCAIHARVEEGQVTLWGTVEEKAQAERALEVARRVAVQAEVVDEIRIRGAASR